MMSIFLLFTEVKEGIFKPGPFEWLDSNTAQQAAASAQMNAV